MQAFGLSYTVDRDRILRRLSGPFGSYESSVEFAGSLSTHDSLDKVFDREVLRAELDGSSLPTQNSFTVVDAFSGGGALSLAAKMAGELVDADLRPLTAIDVSGAALRAYGCAFPDAMTLKRNVDLVVDYATGRVGSSLKYSYGPDIIDPEVAELVGRVDLLVGGPPCQGHSNANNRTRRDDPRNILYLSAVALAVALQAPSVVLENVPDIVHDRGAVVNRAKSLLRSSGYFVAERVLNAADYGLPQQRRRHFLMASRHGRPLSVIVSQLLRKEPRDVRWAIGDLQESDRVSVIDRPAELSEPNRRRIKELFDKDIYDLPSSSRPTCHQNGHTYPAVYGRLKWDKPAGTITQGFMSPGRGRYVHPSQRRTLTIHEAARLQGLPDWFISKIGSIEKMSKSDLIQMVGEAVPPSLGTVPILATMMRPLIRNDAVKKRKLPAHEQG